MSGLELLTRGTVSSFSAGISEGMQRQEYDAIPALNCSTLKKWIELVIMDGGCPKKFGHWLRTRDEGEKSEALLLGSALDCLLLEPDEFPAKYAVAPVVNTRTKEGKAQMEAFEAANPGKDILTAKQHFTVLSMEKEVSQAPMTQDVFKYCRKAVLQAELNGVPCKGEVDLFSDQTEFLFDLKTTRDASLKPFARSAWDLGYIFQAAFYLKMAHVLGFENKRSFCFVAVENSAPYCVAAYVVEWESDVIQYAWKMIQQAMNPLMYCLTRNDFPDFGDFTPLAFAKHHRFEASEFLKEFLP